MEVDFATRRSRARESGAIKGGYPRCIPFVYYQEKAWYGKRGTRGSSCLSEEKNKYITWKKQNTE